VTYDKTHGHVTYGCAECCGWADAPYMYYDPISVILGFGDDQDVWDTDICTEQRASILFAISSSSWSTGNTAIATARNAVITGVGIGSTTNSASGLLETGIGGGGGRKCPVVSVYPSGPAQTTPMVTIDSLSPNPIQAGTTATAHVTITPSAPVTMAIVSTGSGTATFGTSQNTSLVISESENLTITGGAVTTGAGADLSLNATYNGSPVASPINCSVTNGSCTATYAGHAGSVLARCPTAPVTITDIYTLAQYCPTCKFTCLPIGYDSTFTPTVGGCAGSTAGPPGAPNPEITLTDQGTFTSSDCKSHNLQIQTTVTDANGKVTNYVGGTFGLVCNANGTPACN
jgi:hypothetical protein